MSDKLLVRNVNLLDRSASFGNLLTEAVEQTGMGGCVRGGREGGLSVVGVTVGGGAWEHLSCVFPWVAKRFKIVPCEP